MLVNITNLHIRIYVG